LIIINDNIIYIIYNLSKLLDNVDMMFKGTK